MTTPREYPNTLTRLICGFVEKSGGVEKMDMAKDSLMRIAPGKRADFLRGLSKSEEGAKQLIAAAIAGFSLSAFVYRELRGTKKQEPS